MLVDGLPNVTAKTAEPRSDIPQDAVREFAVHTTQQPAEYGWRPGGAISIVTKSGTNLFSGDAFEFYRNQNLNRVDKFAQAAVDAGTGQAPKYNRSQFGATLGGPIIKNKFHFFGSYEHSAEHAYFTVTAPQQFYGSFNGAFLGGSTQNLEQRALRLSDLDEPDDHVPLPERAHAVPVQRLRRQLVELQRGRRVPAALHERRHPHMGDQQPHRQ